MTNKSNVQSTGAIGPLFENSVQTAFAITILLNGRVPTLPEGNITSIRLQAKVNTDDFLLKLRSADGLEYQFFAQIKHHLIFSSNDPVFKTVIKGIWEDYNNSEVFNRHRDKLVIIVGD